MGAEFSTISGQLALAGTSLAVIAILVGVGAYMYISLGGTAGPEGPTGPRGPAGPAGPGTSTTEILKAATELTAAYITFTPPTGGALDTVSNETNVRVHTSGDLVTVYLNLKLTAESATSKSFSVIINMNEFTTIPIVASGDPNETVFTYVGSINTSTLSIITPNPAVVAVSSPELNKLGVVFTAKNKIEGNSLATAIVAFSRSS